MYTRSRGALTPLLTGLLTLAIAGGTPAWAQTPTSDAGRLDCTMGPAAAPFCVLKASRSARFQLAVADTKTDGDATSTRLDAQFTPFSGANRFGSHSVVLLIDNSTNFGPDGPGSRSSTLEKVREAVRESYRALPQGARAAMIVYSDTFETMLDFGASLEEVNAALDTLTFTGRQTRSFAAIREAVNALRGEDGLTRTVLHFTDGLAEDVVERESVQAEAVDSDVAVSTLIVHYLTSGQPKRGEAFSLFEGLAAETGGVSAQSGPEDRSDPGADFVSRLGEQLANSGIISVDGLTVPANVTVQMRVASDGTEGAIVPLTGTLDPDIEAVVPPPWWEPYKVPGIIGLLLLLLLPLLYILLRRRKEGDAAYGPDGKPLDWDAAEGGDGYPANGAAGTDPGLGGGDEQAPDWPGEHPGIDSTVHARLVMAADGRQYEVRSAKVSIGRGNENDVVLKDDSISRIHSELHMTRDGDFAVTDLGSLNHTLVNGEQVKTRVLETGDHLRLGEVELVYHRVHG